MKISLNWINEFVDLKGIDIKDIVSRFSLTTAEVEGYEVKGNNLENVVVGEIKTCEAVPGKKLHKLTVDDGTATCQVICGAPNVRVGLKTAFARVGARLGEVQIGKATIAGIESCGMCCAADELGIGNDHDGIIELDAKTKVGIQITEALPEILDTILELDNKSLTNRPDLWGHYGIAREMAVIFNKPLKTLTITELDLFASLPKVPITIENKKDCLSYGAIRVNNITRAKSPLFMQTRLYYCGINAHNFLVDLTNYIMLETAQPNHAFDATKVGKISIGNLMNGAEFITLKDQIVKAVPEMLFIKSDKKPVALAGVMGGKNSEIDENTVDCVFEFATFDAANVRKTSQALGIRTDASNRYEKSLDTNLNRIAAARTIRFIEAYDKNAKVVTCFNHVTAKATQPVRLEVKKDYLERFCGVKFNYDQVKKNLTGLGFVPVITEHSILVTVPTYRATKDVTCEADVIEEIIRTFGYDNVKPMAPRVELKPATQLKERTFEAKIKNLLCEKYALNEVHTYIWNNTKLNKQLNIETASYLRVLNSCVKDDDAVRSEMIPSMLNIVAKNRQLDDIRVFEIGRVCTGLDANKNAIEKKQLSVAIASKTLSGAQLYKKLADMFRDLLSLHGIRVQFSLSNAKQKYFHPTNNAVIKIGGNSSGAVGIIHPSVAGAVHPQINISSLQIDLTALGDVCVSENLALKVSKYQKSILDFTFVTDKIYGEIEDIFSKFKHILSQGFHLKDVYEDAVGTKNYTLSWVVGSYEKTLTSDDINSIWQAIIDYGRKHGLTVKE